jgi:quercetin dioxygenase-like cupin family protein
LAPPRRNLEQKVAAEGHRAESDAAISARPLKAHETQKEDTMTATIPAELDMKTAGRVENYLDRIKRSFEPNYDGNLPSDLVVSSESADWLDPKQVSNPARIGPLLALPTRSFEISLQQIAGSTATDLQRHAHEAVHYVVAGTGYSEIGGRRCPWKEGDFIYTPPWVVHRHYNTGRSPARLIIIENSKLLEALGLHQRESIGLIDYATYLGKHSASDAAP